MPSDSPIFYVYEHWRPDLDLPFWVGKGSGARARTFRRRNRHYGNVAEKLKRRGLSIKVVIVQRAMTEKVAHAVEVGLISFWRLAGAPLTNKTNGGEGVAGLIHSDETRARMREKRRLQSRTAHSAVMRGRKAIAGTYSRPARWNERSCRLGTSARQNQQGAHWPEATRSSAREYARRPVGQKADARMYSKKISSPTQVLADRRSQTSRRSNPGWFHT